MGLACSSPAVGRVGGGGRPQSPRGPHMGLYRPGSICTATGQAERAPILWVRKPRHGEVNACGINAAKTEARRESLYSGGRPCPWLPGAFRSSARDSWGCGPWVSGGACSSCGSHRHVYARVPRAHTHHGAWAEKRHSQLPSEHLCFPSALSRHPRNTHIHSQPDSRDWDKPAGKGSHTVAAMRIHYRGPGWSLLRMGLG